MPISFQTQSGVRHQTIGFASNRGTLVTATTANTKTAWNVLGTATEFGFEQFNLFLNMGTTVAANFVVDVGIASIGAATGISVIAQDIRMEGIIRLPQGNTVAYIPVSIPKDSSVWTRVSGSVASGNVFVYLIGSSRGLRGMPGYARCFTLGTATASRGHTLLATTGGPLTEGRYTVLTNNSARRADAIFGLIGVNADTAKTAAMAWAIDIAWGSSTAAISNQIDNITTQAEVTADGICNNHTGIYPCHIPAGSAVQARMLTTSTATADSAIDLLLYGLEP